MIGVQGIGFLVLMLSYFQIGTLGRNGTTSEFRATQKNIRCIDVAAIGCTKYMLDYLNETTRCTSEQNHENKAFQMGFMHPKIKIKEKFKLKTKLTKTKI